MAAPKKAQVNKFDAQLAALAAQSATAEENALAGGSFLSTKGGRLSYKGQMIPGDKMNIVVIDSVLENSYYDVPYEPNSPASPVCYAFGRDEKTMAPHDKAPEPECTQCKGCHKNEFGSADRGAGKACSNLRRLAFIVEGDLKDVEAADVTYLKVPVMSVKNWASYVTTLHSTLQRPPLAVVTELSVVPDDKSQFRLQFKLVAEIKDSATLTELLSKNEVEQERIAFPYQVVEREEAPAPQQKGGKAAPKKGAPGKYAGAKR